MEQHSPKHRPTPSTMPTVQSTEEGLADLDEPPESPSHWNPPKLPTTFGKANTAISTRRESLLTRQLHSEVEQSTDDEESVAPPRALSTQSTWSNPSIASTAELTSDDGHSVASPAISPPFPPTTIRTVIPNVEKPLSREPQIVGHEEKGAVPSSEDCVEAGLGRKRCISFACGNMKTTEPVKPSQPTGPALVQGNAQSTAASPPKRKCSLKFVCPTRTSTERPPALDTSAIARRNISPPPPERRPSSRGKAAKTHRGSDSTVTHGSPKSVRKVSSVSHPAATPVTTITESFSRRRLSLNSNSSTEATRFHEFASSEDEPEEWVQESGCHRSRLTVNDTLKKENILRKACEEVEEEAIDEEENEDDDEDLGDDDVDDDDQNDVDEDDEDEVEDDDGFHSDDEEGFAASDSEGEESDEDWWRPGGRSTAATSIEHMDRLTLTQKDDNAAELSVGSASSRELSPKGLRIKSRRRRHSPGLTIASRQQPVDLPDSTDFVCGTLDEDRPLEQAFLNHLKQKEAAKHKARPQDIDPTFPTSDPEMDEEDDEDLEDPEEGEKEDLMHGDLDELDNEPQTLKATTRPRARSNANKSPPPATRRRSPAPAMLKKCQATARSPPPPTRRSTARSPPPRKLFGQSPKRNGSPAPRRAMPSPPNTRRVSPWAPSTVNVSDILAGRPQLTYTASLPRSGFQTGHKDQLDSEDSFHARGNIAGEVPKRGAIDIYKGLEKKRQRRKEKMYQKLCAKAAAKGEKAYKVKPGRGAERMREVGLELQRYRGKGEHILSM